MAKRVSAETVSRTELQILDQLWDSSPLTIREICDAVYGETSTSYYATVQSLLERLEKKDWVQRDRTQFKHTFSATRSRSDFVGHQIQDVADAVCGGSIPALLGQFAKFKPLTKKERNELKKLIEGMES